VADSDGANLDLAAKRFDVPGYTDSQEMFRNHEIDIAVASLPVRANHDVVIAAAEAGVKAMVTEKPLTARLSEADEMVEVCQSRGIQFASGLVSKNRINHWVARELIEVGEIGEVLRINIYDGNTQGGCHGINLARHFASDSEVDFVIGFTKGDPFSDYEDAHSGREDDPGFQALGGYIRFQNGIEAFSSYQPIGWRGIEVVGTQGLLYKESTTALKLSLLKASTKNTSFDAFAEVGVPDIDPPIRDAEHQYDGEGWGILTDGMVRSAAAIVESLETGEDLKLTTGDDLRKALEICIAMRESARLGRVPVSLPLEDRSLVMYPQNSRWNYKKEIMGHDAYMNALAQQKRE
jgi:predicted dehydrogenase